MSMPVAKPRTHGETEQRIMAVMYLNPDGIVHPGGYAISKLRNYMAAPPGLAGVRQSVRRLEAANILLRDGRPKSKVVNAHGSTIDGCFGIHLMVDRDDLLDDRGGPLDRQYIDELRAKIDERMANPKKGRPQASESETVYRHPRKPASGPGATQETPENGSSPADHTPADAIADALLRKVIERAQQPAGDPAAAAAHQAEVERLQQRIVDLEGDVARRDQNLEVLVSQVKQLDAENGRLKNQATLVASRRRDTSEHLTATIGDLVGDTLMAGLKNGDHA